MAFNDNIPEVEYLATQDQAIFSFDFQVSINPNVSTLRVYLTYANASPSSRILLSQDTDYTLTLLGDTGGSILLAVPLDAGDKLVLDKYMFPNVFTDYTVDTNLNPSTLNFDFENVTYYSLQLEKKLNRIFKVADGIYGVDTTITNPVPYGVIRWNDQGTQLLSDPALQGGIDLAVESSIKAEQWATNPYSVPVEPNRFSALHYATQSEIIANSITSISNQIEAFYITNILDTSASTTLIEVLQSGTNQPTSYVNLKYYNIILDNTFATYNFQTNVQINISGIGAITINNFTIDLLTSTLELQYNQQYNLFTYKSIYSPVRKRGDIYLSPFDVSELEEGEFLCNGSILSIFSIYGSILNSLPSAFKTRWGITTSSLDITLPDLFYVDGRGYFLRAVDGTTRAVGSVELDQLQEHNHYYYNSADLLGGGGNYIITSKLLTPQDSSGVNNANVGTETRSINIGMSPFICLGV